MEQRAARLAEPTTRRSDVLSLKQQLVAAVAKGHEQAADNIRVLLKTERTAASLRRT